MIKSTVEIIYHTRSDTRSDVIRYIKISYNSNRLHSYLELIRIRMNLKRILCWQKQFNWCPYLLDQISIFVVMTYDNGQRYSFKF